MNPAGDFTLHVEQVDAFEFRVRFDKEHYTELQLDEPAPLGRDTAPNAARILAAAIGDCLSASLVFCLKKRGVAVQGVRSELSVHLVRNERNRLRIGRIDVNIDPGNATSSGFLEACLSTFEDFCVVTQSVRQGIDVRVNVLQDPARAQLG